MKVIDILNKRANNEEIPLKIKIAGDIYVMNKFTENLISAVTIERIYVWEENNDDSWFDRERLTLNTEVEIVEEEPEKEKIKELPPLEYIQDLHSGFMKFTYGGRTVGTDDDTMILAKIVNRLIREVEDLKTRMDCMDKSMEEQAKIWNRRVQSLNSDINRLCKDIDDKAYTNHIMKSN